MPDDLNATNKKQWSGIELQQAIEDFLSKCTMDITASPRWEFGLDLTIKIKSPAGKTMVMNHIFFRLRGE